MSDPPVETAPFDPESGKSTPVWLEVALLGGLTLVAAVIRGWHLGDWALDGDEIETIHEADALGRSDRTLTSRSTLFTGPLLHWCYRALLPLVQDPVLAARLPAYFASVLTIPVLHRGLRSLYGPGISLSACALLTFCPLHAHISTYGRYYAPVVLLVGAAGLSLLQVVRTSRPAVLLSGICLLFLGCGFHTTSLFAGTAICVGWVAASRRHVGRRILWSLLALFLAVSLPWIWLGPQTAFQAGLGQLQGAEQRGSSFSGLRIAASLVHDLGLAIPLLAALGLWQLFRQKRPERFAAACLVFVPLVMVSLLGLRFHVGTRYVYGIIVPVVALAGVGLGHLAAPLTRRPRALLALLALALIPSVPVLLSNLLKDNSRYEVAGVTDTLLDQHRPGEPVFAESHALTEFYSGLSCTEIPQSAQELEAMLPRTGRAYVVLLLQRGQAIGTADPSLQVLVESRMRLLDRAAQKRYDMHRFETRLYLWEPPGSG